LTVANASTLGSTLAVTGASTLSSTLRVAGASTIDNTLKVNDTLTVSKASTLSSTLTVANASILKSTLKVSNATTLSSTLYVANDVSMDTVVTIGGDVSLNNKLYVANDVSMDSILMVGGDVSMNSKLTVHDDVTVENGGITTNDISLNVSQLPFFATGAFTDNEQIVYSKFSNSDRVLNGLYDISASSVEGTNHPWNVADSTSLSEWVSASGTGQSTQTIVTYIDNAVSTTVNGEYIQFAFPFHIKLNQYVINTNNSVKDVRLIGFKDNDFYHMNTFTNGTKGGNNELDTIPIDTSFYSNLFRVVFPQNSNNTPTISVISLSFSGDVIGSKVSIDNGNIGIGNVNPRSALEITGNMVLSNATSGINNSGENQEHGRITWAGIGRDISDNHSSYIRSYFEDETYDTSGNLAFGTSDGTTIAEDRFIIHSTGKNEFITDVSMDSGLFVGGDVSLNSKLYVSGAATMGSTLNVNDTLSVSKASTLSSTLNVVKASTLKSTLNVSKAATLSSTLAVTGASTMSSTLKVNDTLTVSKASILSSTLNVSKASTLKSTLNVSKAATLSSTLAVTGASTMGSTLKVNDTLTVSKASTLSSTLDVVKAATLKSTLKISKAATLSSTLAVTGASTMGSTLKVNDTLTVSGDTSLNGELYVNNTITVSGNILPMTHLTHDIGSAQKSFRDIYMSNGTMYNVDSDGNTNSMSTDQGIITVTYTDNTDSVNPITTDHVQIGSVDNKTGMGGLASTDASFTLDIQGNLRVTQDVSLNSTLHVGGASTMGSTLKVNDTFTVSKASTLNSTLAVTGASTMGSTLNVAGESTMSTLTVTNASVSSMLEVTGDVSINYLSANHKITATDLSINNDVVIHNNAVIGNSNLSDNEVLTVIGKVVATDFIIKSGADGITQLITSKVDTVQLGSSTTSPPKITTGTTNADIVIQTGNSDRFTIDENGNTTFSNDVSMNAGLEVSNKLLVAGASTINNTLKVNDTLTVSKAATLSSTLDVSKASTLKSTLAVSKAATLSSTLDVTGATTIGSTLKVNDTLTVSKASTLKSTLAVSRATTLSSTLNVMSDVSMNAGLVIGGKLVNNGDVSMNAGLVIGGKLVNNGDVSMNAGLVVGGDVSMNSNVTVNGDLQIYGKLDVNQIQNTNTMNTTVNEYTLVVTEDLSINGGLSVSEDLSLNGNANISNKIIVDKDGDVTITNQNIVIGNSIYLSSVIGGGVFDNITEGLNTYTQSFAGFNYTISASSYNSNSNFFSVASAFVNNNNMWNSNLNRYIDDGTTQLIASTTNPITTSYFPSKTIINEINQAITLNGEYVETTLPYSTTIDNFEIHTNTYQVPTLGILLANMVNSSGVDVWVKLVDYNKTTITDVSLLRDTKFSFSIPGGNQLETTKIRFVINKINKSTSVTETIQDSFGNQIDIYNKNVSIRYINFSGLVQNAGISIGAGSSQNSANTSAGFATLAKNQTGKNNIAFGNYALSQTTNNDNVAVGYNSLIANTGGSSNIGVGSNTLLNNSIGSNNSALGTNSGSSNDRGTNNTFIGTNSGYSNRDGNNNTFVGYNTDISGNHSHSTAIGADAKVTEDNQIVIGTTTDNVKIPGTIELNGTFSGDISFNNNIKVSGSTILQSTLNVDGASIIDDTLNVTGKTTLNTLDVNGITNFKSNVAVTSGNTLTSDDIVINGPAELNNTLEITGAATFNNTLSVANSTTFKSTLNVENSATLQSRLDVGGDVSFNKNATITNLNVTGNTSANTLTTSGASTINGKLTVAPNQDVNLANKLIINDVNRTTITDDIINISNFIEIKNNKITITGTTNNTEVMDVTGIISANSVLLKAGGSVTTTGDTASTSTSTIVGDTSNGMGIYPLDTNPFTGIKFEPFVNESRTNNVVFSVTNSGDTNIIGDLTVDNSLNVTGKSNLINLETTGYTSLNNLHVTSATTLNSTLNVTHATTLASSLNVTGTTTLSDVTVNDETTLSSTLSVSNATTLSSTLNVIGSSTFNDTLTVSKETALNFGVDISGNVSVTNGEFMTNNILYNVSNLPRSKTGSFNNYNQKIIHSQYSDSERVFNGLYDISTSSVYGDNLPWYMFDDSDTSVWKSGENTGTSSNTDVRYIDSNGDIQGVSGEYIQVKFPFYTKLSSVFINAFFSNSNNIQNTTLLGYHDGSFNLIKQHDDVITGNSTSITEITNLNSSFYSDTFRIIFPKNNNNPPEIVISNLSFNGDVFGSKVHIDNGSIGVGTTDPRSALEVTGDMVISKPINGENTSGDSVEHGRIVWAGIGRDISNNNHSSYIRSYFENGTYDTSGNLAFGTSDGTTVANDRFVINANGINNFITDVSMDSNLAVNGDVSFNSNLYVKEKVWVEGTVGVGTASPVVVFDISDNGALRIPVGESSQRPIDITGGTSNTSYYGSIRYNTNNAEFEGYGPGGTWNTLAGVSNISKNTKITAAEPSTADTNNELKFYTASVGSIVTNETKLRMIITNTGDISMNHKLSVIGDVSFNSNLDVAKASTLKSTLKVSGASTLSSTLAVTGASTMGSTLKVNDTLTISKASTLSSTLDVAKASTLKSTLKVSKAATLSSTLDVAKASTLKSTLVVSKAATLSSTLEVTGKTTFKNDISLNGHLFIAGDLSLNGNLSVIQQSNETIINTTINDYTLIVSEDISLNGKLKISDDASFNNNLYVKEKVWVDGTMGIGTANPVVIFDISDTGALRLPVGNNIQRPVATDVDDDKYYGSIRYNTNTSQFEGYGPGGAWGSLGGVINIDQNTKILAADPNPDSTNNQLTFYTNGSMNMIIDSTGDVSMGNNLTVHGELNVNGKTYLSDNVGIGRTPTSYKLDVNGDVNATSYNASSDYRIKENVVPIADTSYNVDNLRPVTYTNIKMEKQDFGVIAHELQEQIPFLVTGEKDGEHHQSVNYNGLIGLLLNEVQQLKKRVQELEQSKP